MLPSYIQEFFMSEAEFIYSAFFKLGTDSPFIAH
jgi:hypothetical protein